MVTNIRYKNIVLIIYLVAVCIFFIGCSNESTNYNSALDNMGIENIKDDSLAVIINNPEENQLKEIKNLKSFEYNKGKESLLIIPIYNNMDIKLKTLVWNEDNLQEDKKVYEEHDLKDGYGLKLKAVRPEGIPSLKISIYGDEIYGEYILSYDGKNGTPKVEYIRIKEE